MEALGLTTITVWSDTGKLENWFFSILSVSPADRLTLAGPYHGLTRGQAASEVRASLVQQGLLLSEVEGSDEIMFTKYGDITYIKDCMDIKKDTEVINLRKPVLLVSSGEEPPAVLSSNLNIEAVDNKMVCEATGRTGGFCTGCSANEADMHSEQGGETFFLNLGADKVWLHFKELRAQLDQEDLIVDEVVIPSGQGNYRQRLGTKHAPLTDQIELAKVLTGNR